MFFLNYNQILEPFVVYSPTSGYSVFRKVNPLRVRNPGTIRDVIADSISCLGSKFGDVVRFLLMHMLHTATLHMLHFHVNFGKLCVGGGPNIKHFPRVPGVNKFTDCTTTRGPVVVYHTATYGNSTVCITLITRYD